MSRGYLVRIMKGALQAYNSVVDEQITQAMTSLDLVTA